jgi:7-carboxy-7-deazaguanine synthase
MARRRYSVKSIFLTLQGEGHNVGRLAVFCRFAGCNLWTGRERDRGRATCRFCDTDFVGTDGYGGGVYPTADVLTEAILARWPNSARPFVVFTGGEPTLQLDDEIVGRLHAEGAELAIETNGTNSVVAGVDWICVSPKAGAPLRQTHGDELKVAWPQPLDLDVLERLAFRHRWLQPIDGPLLEENARHVFATCRLRPAWRMSTQMHKVVGLP